MAEKTTNTPQRAAKTVTVVSSKFSGRKEFSTTATNFAELKRDLQANNIDFNNMKVLVRENRNTLEDNAALLPDEPTITLFLTPKQVKSGASKSDKFAGFEWSDKGYNDIRVFASSKCISSMGTVLDIKERLLRWEQGKSKKDDAASGKTIIPKVEDSKKATKKVEPAKVSSKNISKATVAENESPTRKNMQKAPEENVVLQKLDKAYEQIRELTGIIEDVRDFVSTNGIPVGNGSTTKAVALNKKTPTDEELQRELQELMKNSRY